jgi:uncharacterized protein YaaN involved in tellurite resistance
MEFKSDNKSVIIDTTAVELDKEKYDIVADRQEMRIALTGSAEIDALTTQIRMDDPNTIMTFGATAADEISTAADTVLKSMSLESLDKTSTMMTKLNKIMKNFDIAEVQGEQKGLSKIFTSSQRQLEKVLNKYKTMDKDVEGVYVELKQYEAEIKKANQTLSDMFQANVNTYHDLVKYIMAGEQAGREIAAYIAQRKKDMEETGDTSISFEIQNLEQGLMMMEQRTQDLRAVESIAMQSIPMIKAMEFSNLNLVRKINSAFIITLPVFKQSLAQAMLLRRQAIQSESLAKLDKVTNEMLIKNAQNTVENTKNIMRQVSQASVKTETLEQTWQIIMTGISDTQQIQEESRRQRVEDGKKLAQLKESFEKGYAKMPDKKGTPSK